MKTILFFLASITLSFAQNPELFSNDWHLVKMVVDDVDYPTPTQYEHIIGFETQSGSASDFTLVGLNYCTNYLGFISLISDDTILNQDGFFFNPGDDVCNFIENTLSYLGGVYMFFQNEGIINYVINEVDNYKQLVLTNLDSKKLYFNNITLSQEDFLFEKTVSLYPNPVQNILNIQNTASNFSKVQIYDLNGRLLQNHLVQNNEIFLDVSQLNSGVYVVVLENETGNQISRKIVKTTK